jgi:hypothetical protein
MKNRKTLAILSAIISIIGVLSALETLPFIPQELAVVIIGIGASFTPAIIALGDLLDDGKLNNSYQPKTTRKS